jgi:hypothetical protein
MTFADVIILILVSSMIVGFISMNFRKKDQNVCSKCAYAKSCTDECDPKKKKISSK